MESSPGPIRVLATRWCGDCRMARRVLDEAGVDYEWTDIDQSPAARDEVMRLNRGMRSVPTIIFRDGSVLVEPSRRVLQARLAETQRDAAGAAGAAGAAACATDAGLPDCATGPVGRAAFVFQELKGILTRHSGA